MPLCTDLTGQLEGVDNLLFSLFDFFEGKSSLEPHLEIEADNFKDLFVSGLESNRLFVPVGFTFTLNDKLDFILFIADGLSEECGVFVAIFDVLREIEASFDFSGLVTDGINHLSALQHKPLLKQRSVGAFFNTLDALRVLLSQNKYSDTV